MIAEDLVQSSYQAIFISKIPLTLALLPFKNDEVYRFASCCCFYG